MTDSKGITISAKNLSTWLVIAGIIISSVVDSALMRYSLDQLEKIDEKYPQAEMYTNQINMADDIAEIKEGIKALLEK